jgi:hypothetical protein
MSEQTPAANAGFGPLGALRKFVRSPQSHASKEYCDLCRAPLVTEHQHLIEPESRRLVCACDACAILFDRASNAQYRRVPRRGRFLVDFHLADDLWDEFSIPINVAFFFRSSPAERILAMYPSPVGPTESLLPLSAWETLTRVNPLLASIQPDVEALLVNRLGPRRGFTAHETYLAPIDACYQLVGLMRLHWRGLGGGEEVWREISQFFRQFQSACLRVETELRVEIGQGSGSQSEGAFAAPTAARRCGEGDADA